MRIFAGMRDGSSCELALPVAVDPPMLENYIYWWMAAGFATIWGTHNHVMFHAIDYIKVEIISEAVM